jgi:UDP-N-acetylglucosamine enolpyruvyl transferase
LLADSPVIIRNVPHLHDVTTTMELLGRMACALYLSGLGRVWRHAPGRVPAKRENRY